MSYGSKGPVRPYGAQDATGAGAPQQKGSVRAARERMMAAQDIEPSGQPEIRQQPLRGNPLASQYSSMRSPQNPQSRGSPPSARSQDEPQAHGGAPSPQWPLTNYATQAPAVPSAPPRNGDRPLRPPRPSNPGITVSPAASYSDNRNTLSPQDAAGERAYWQDDDAYSPSAYTSPNPNRPLTTSTLSTNSSLGEIPDFPVPTASMLLPRRTQNLGPPPSARRGPSSYYSQASYVSPIAEESETRGSMGSFASRGSSNVIPSGVPEFYLEEGEGETPSDDEEGRFSPRATARTGEVPVGIVRQASLGKKSRPTLTTIKSSSDSREAELIQPRERPPRRGQMSPQGGSQDSGTILLDPSSPLGSSSEESLSRPTMRVGLARTQSEIEDLKGGFPAPPAANMHEMDDDDLSPVDPRVDQILGGLEKGGALDPSAASLRQAPKSSLGDRIGQRRPPRLNVDAVREAEVRGSMTSLPDLIRRATRLAANLDRGRTASKLGMDWMFADNANRGNLSRNASEEKLGNSKRKSEGSLSGILAAFPNPGQETPRTPDDRWPSVPSSQRQINGDSRKKKKKKKGRRCCGMPLWGFLLLLFILLLLVAAAVVIPVVLIVLPRIHNKNNNANNQLQVCQNTSPCENSGTSIVQAGNTCGCICANGFTGPRCLNPADAGCSSVSVPGQKNATIGSEVPMLLQFAPQYSIPLNTSTLLSIFATTNSTCASENALITFSGFTKSKRRRRRSYSGIVPLRDEVQQAAPLVTAVPTPFVAYRKKNKRDDSNTITTNGVLLDGTGTVTLDTASPSGTSTAALPAQPSASSGTSVTSSAQPGTNSTSLTFARLSILFILQESSSLTTAVLAQNHIEQFLTYARDQGVTVAEAENVDLGFGDAMVDLVNLTVRLGNGTVFGMGFNGTATSFPPPSTTTSTTESGMA